jgi:exonuclease 3'-5' domain-containing protein 1
VGDGEPPQEEILAVVDVPAGKMGLVIGRKGSSILSIKQSCR